MSKQKRYDYIDILRSMSIFFVVLIHTSDSIVWASDWFNQNPKWWWTAAIFDMISTPGVNIFIMISGLLLLYPSKDESVKTFLRKRFLRILPPFIIWSVIYWRWSVYINEEIIPLQGALRSFADGGLYYHLWFMYMILLLYLLTPLFRIITKHAEDKLLFYAVAVWFCLVVILPEVQRFFQLEGSGIEITSFLNYAGYFFFGAYLRNKKLRKWRHWGLDISFILGSFAYTTYELYKHTKAAGGYLEDLPYDFNFAPSVAVLSISIFLFVKSIPWEKLLDRVKGWRPIIHLMGRASFTVYLAHPIILETLEAGYFGFTLYGAKFNPLFAIPITAGLTFLLCTLAYMLYDFFLHMVLPKKEYKIFR